MSTESREAVFSRVRIALRPEMVRTPYPTYDDREVITLAAAADAWSAFEARLQEVHARMFTAAAALADFLRGQGWTRGYCDPSLRTAVGEKLGTGFNVTYEFDLARIDEHQFGITRAAGAIAETGTIVLNDATTSTRLAALAPWVHIAVLEPRNLWRDIPAALRQLGDDPNTIWVTGPSKTGDIEGVLVEGVHGPGVQICLRVEL
jgi:L-lactate dehydrogenase complex protein LldG